MRRLSSLVILVALSQLGATDCGGGVIQDPGFDLWCGDLLCSWKLERGDVQRVPTWHESDSGVSLIGEDTAIEQFSSVNNFDGTCLQFDMVTNVDPTAEAQLNIDVYGDGSVEKSFTIGAAHWQPVSFTFAIKAPYTGVRFELAKQGPGSAVLARINAHIVHTCDGLTPIDGGLAPLGAACTTGTMCESGKCAGGFFGELRCVGCTFGDGSCTADQVCGLGDPQAAEREVPVECVAKHGRVLGEQCLGPDECATGICNHAVCSTCVDGTGCASGTCGLAYDRGPSVCDPGAGKRAHGEPCATGADCTSGTCAGPEHKQCAGGDTRACESSFNCPVGGDLQPTECLAVGVQGGSCN